jgi:hypothetical protein
MWAGTKDAALRLHLFSYQEQETLSHTSNWYGREQ